MRVLPTTVWRRAGWSALMIAILFAIVVQAQKEVRKDPLKGFLFRVEIDGLNAGFFKSVSGLAIETEVIEFREGGSDVIHKLPGVRKFANIVMKRGFTGSSALYDWFNSFNKANPARVNGSIVMLSADLNEVARWEFHNGFPVKWEGPEFDASSNDVPIETLEIAHEGLVMVKP